MPKTDTETTAKAPSSPAPAAVKGDHDRVVMASRLADGTPDQTPDFEFIGDRDVTLAATKEQLATIAVHAVDAERHSPVAPAAGEEGSSEPDPIVSEDIKAKEAAAEAGAKAAEAEVAARFDIKG